MTCRVLIVSGLLLPWILGSVPAIGDELDVGGSWQANIRCEPGIQVIQTFELSADVSTGIFDFALGPNCGTVALDNAVRPLGQCVAAAGVQGAVSGSSFSVPQAGSFAFTGWFAQPYPSQAFPSCDPFARYDIQLRIEGTIQDDGMGRATRVDGYWAPLTYSLYTATDEHCVSGTCAQTCCTVTLLRNDVAAGAAQSVSPYEGATVTFAAVDVAGHVIITPLEHPAALVPGNFQLFDAPVYFDVTTTAGVSGPITVCLPYPDADNDGFVDGTTPSIDETRLSILHEEGGVFVDRTSSLDPVADVICAQVDSLSQFVLGTRVPLCGDGVVDAGETCDLGFPMNGVLGACCTAFCTLQAAGDSCRPAQNACDVEETCNGFTPDCPPDGFAPPGAPCSVPIPPCMAASCDGLGGCVTAPVANGASCDDGLACNGSDHCLDGACLHAESSCAVIAAPGSYKCHVVKDLQSPPFAKRKDPGVSIDDSFAADPDVDVLKPALFCNPADVDGGGLGPAPAPLCCYKVRGRKTLPNPRLATSDGFGDLSLLIVKPQLLCQPCTAAAIP